MQELLSCLRPCLPSHFVPTGIVGLASLYCRSYLECHQPFVRWVRQPQSLTEQELNAASNRPYSNPIWLMATISIVLLWWLCRSLGHLSLPCAARSCCNGHAHHVNFLKASKIPHGVAHGVFWKGGLHLSLVLQHYASSFFWPAEPGITGATTPCCLLQNWLLQ